MINHKYDVFSKSSFLDTIILDLNELPKHNCNFGLTLTFTRLFTCHNK